jgi:NAD(P)H-hydrate epimerase
VLARACAAAGVPVRLLALEAPSDFPPGPARDNADLLPAFGVPVATLDPGSLKREARAAEVVVDALLGTGISGRVRPPYDAAIEAVNACGRPVLALDLPSGLHGDTGLILGCAVRATWTVTFGAWKAGMFAGEGPRRCGIPRLVHLPFSPEAWRRIGLSPRIHDS